MGERRIMAQRVGSVLTAGGSRGISPYGERIHHENIAAKNVRQSQCLRHCRQALVAQPKSGIKGIYTCVMSGRRLYSASVTAGPFLISTRVCQNLSTIIH